MNLQEVLKVTAANDTIGHLSLSPLRLRGSPSRITAAKPHSCDVERLVSAYNQLKDPYRCKMSSKAIDAYLNIPMNMSPLAEFVVRPSVRQWMATKARRE